MLSKNKTIYMLFVSLRYILYNFTKKKKKKKGE